MSSSAPKERHAVLRPAGFPPVRVVAGPRGIRRVDFMATGRRETQSRSGDRRHPLLRRATNLLDRYFKGRPVDFSALTVDLTGCSPFQRTVYRVLRKIPYGEVRTYGWIALEIGQPGAARAVGRVMGANPLPILFPCHRVVAAHGLGGFSCGLHIKRKLLKLEDGDPPP